MTIKSLLETILTEAVALTKGSQRVMNDKKMVAELADAIRDDAATNPASFPAGSNRTFQKTSDQDLAQWFLENLDKIEREGYEGSVYSRDGVNSEWIVRRYIAGSHNWEDITGVMNMNFRDWYILKNRNLLDANHRDIPKFNSVRDIGRYMTLHYDAMLKDARDAARKAALAKMAKTIKIVDNDDYKIFASLNRAAGMSVGLGTQWCTANSNYADHFHRYSSEAMLFQMFPKDPEEVNKTSGFSGKQITGKEKYQFGADSSLSFKDIADDQVNARAMSQRFPYLYTDITSSLRKNKAKIEQAFKDLSEDPTLQAPDHKIKTYNIEDEIRKLHKFVDRGYMTDQVRPANRANGEEPEDDLPRLPPEPQAESIDILADHMLIEMGIFEKYDINEQPGIFEGPTIKESVMKNVDKDVAAMLRSLKKYDMLAESVAPVLEKKKKPDADGDGVPDWADKKPGKDDHEELDEDESMDDDEDLDEDVQLNELSANKLEKYRDAAKNDTGKNVPDSKYLDYAKKREKGADRADQKIKAKQGDLFGGDSVKESADPEVLEWMQRFAKLGNMKGYGR